MSELINGATYRFVGELSTYRGRTGILSGANKRGRQWFGTLSNHSEWIKAGLAPQIEVIDTELVLVSAPAAKPTAQSQPSTAFDGIEADLVALIEYAAQERGFEVAKVGQHRAEQIAAIVRVPQTDDCVTKEVHRENLNLGLPTVPAQCSSLV